MNTSRESLHWTAPRSRRRVASWKIGRDIFFEVVAYVSETAEEFVYALVIAFRWCRSFDASSSGGGDISVLLAGVPRDIGRGGKGSWPSGMFCLVSLLWVISMVRS